MSLNTISYSAVIAQLLANRRLIARKEQADVAAALGIAPSSYSRIEAGHTALTVDMLFTIANFLGVDIPTLMQETQNIIQKAETSDVLQIEAMARKNITGGGETNNNAGTFITGAAVGALIAALLSK